jgi:hypothetical protein
MRIDFHSGVKNHMKCRFTSTHAHRIEVCHAVGVTPPLTHSGAPHPPLIMTMRVALTGRMPATALTIAITFILPG